MTVSTVSLMKRIASKNIELKDLVFSGFEKVDINDRAEEKSDDLYVDEIEILANFSLKYKGTVPDSYRVINGMIQDWVDDNIDEIKEKMNPKLITFLKDQYREIDLSELDKDLDNFIWDEQVDYFPEIDEKNSAISFCLELAVEVEETDN